MKLLKAAIIKTAGLDTPTLVSFLARSINIVGGVALIYYVTQYLTPLKQGYYYTFFSIVALQVFVELGLNYAVIQIASHEMADLQWSHDRMISGSDAAKKRIQSVMKFAIHWFSYAGLLVVVVLIPLGLWFFEGNAPDSLLFELNLTLILLLISTALLLSINSLLAILEGCNKVVEVALIKFFQTLISTAVICFGLANNFDLYSLVIGSIASLLVGSALIYIFFKSFFIDLWLFTSNEKGIDWRHEMLPFQFKIGISWIAGYLVFQIYSPLLVANGFPIEAGQLGMSLQIISAVNGVFIIWITTKSPAFGQLIAKHNRTELDHIFNRSIIQSTILLALSLVFLFFVIVWISLNHPSYYSRIIELKYWAVLFLACFSNHILFSEAAYLRAHKEESLMILSLINGFFTLFFALILIPLLGLFGAILTYGFSSVFFGLIGGTFIFLRKKNEYANRKFS